MRRENELFAGRLHEYNVFSKDSETNLEEEPLGNETLVREFMIMDQEYHILCAEMPSLNIPTTMTINDASAERETVLTFTSRVVSLVDNLFMGLAAKDTPAFGRWCRV